jgi:Fe-S-cluster containining protein
MSPHHFPLKQAALRHLYEVYEEFSDSWETACKRGCSACCTRNVALTTLEGFAVVQFLQAQGLSGRLAGFDSQIEKKRFIPRMTTNEFARRCLQEEDVMDEEGDPLWGPCPFLENRECPIYPVRPFGCRCMVSTRFCPETGYADMPELILAVNTVFMQYIEHMDAGGYFGNLTDVLLFLADENHRQDYSAGTIRQAPPNLIANHPVHTLMIPPEHREVINGLLQKLYRFSPG